MHTKTACVGDHTHEAQGKGITGKRSHMYLHSELTIAQSIDCVRARRGWSHNTLHVYKPTASLTTGVCFCFDCYSLLLPLQRGHIHEEKTLLAYPLLFRVQPRHMVQIGWFFFLGCVGVDFVFVLNARFFATAFAAGDVVKCYERARDIPDCVAVVSSEQTTNDRTNVWGACVFVVVCGSSTAD